MGHRRHDVFAPSFFAGRRRRVFAGLAAASGARPGDEVLDVGCGTGIFTRVMAEAVAPDGSVHGVDPAGEAIIQARRLTGLPNCTFSTGVDAPDGTYDVLVSSLMIHHLPDALRSRALGEMFRVLRPGASVLVAEFRPPTDTVDHDAVDAYQPFHAARADLLARTGRTAEAISAYDRAIELTTNPAEHRFFAQQRESPRRWVRFLDNGCRFCSGRSWWS